MNIVDVGDELLEALRAIPGLRVPPWGVKASSPPFAIVTLPERFNYDETKGRGFDSLRDVQVIILLAKGNDRTTRADLAAYADGSGPKSVKQAIDGGTYTACGTVRVTFAEPEVVTYAGVAYEALIFHTDITGRGATS